jgi:citronellyl-CoA dehydrogenase
MLFTAEQDEPRRILQKFIAAEINPHVDEWEAAGIFPAQSCSRSSAASAFSG